MTSAWKRWKPQRGLVSASQLLGQIVGGPCRFFRHLPGECQVVMAGCYLEAQDSSVLLGGE